MPQPDRLLSRFDCEVNQVDSEISGAIKVTVSGMYETISESEFSFVVSIINFNRLFIIIPCNSFFINSIFSFIISGRGSRTNLRRLRQTELDLGTN